MIVYEYVTSPTGTVHVARSTSTTPTRTICGTYIRPTWAHGDETVHGAMITCTGCDRRLPGRIA